MYWCKVYKTKHDIVIAVCDENLLGKTVKDEKISLKVSEGFYGGIMVDSDVILKLMNEATVGNLMGAEIVDFAEKNGFITKENVILIDGVPHAQFVKI